ncbi:MAG: hypothetical protein CMM46_09860 [Rhodospirillaceae bacterium]|nr:hypothetical protein [Rhodospirillaceae bacterium]
MASDPGTIVGAITTVALDTPSSLHGNGKVFTRRDRDGNDAGTEGLRDAGHEVPVCNGRQPGDAGPRTLEAHGFELVQRPLGDDTPDFYDHRQVVESYYDACCDLLREATGAPHVFAFDHNIRSARGKDSGQRIAGGQQVQEPIHFVHGDYTLDSAPRRLRDLAKPPSANDTLRGYLEPGATLLDPGMVKQAIAGERRYAIINVWRNIDSAPVVRNPLALCDGQTVAPDDLVVFEIFYHDRVGENYLSKHRDNHGWWWFPEVTRDEAILIKQWDSAGEMARSDGARSDASVGDGDAPCTFSFHSAFKGPEPAPDAPDRQSIEVRCIAIWD